MSRPQQSSWSEPEPPHDGDTSAFATLREASEALTGTADLRAALRDVLARLRGAHDVARGSIVVLNQQTGLPLIDVTEGEGRGGGLVRRRHDPMIAQVVQAQRPLVTTGADGRTRIGVPIVLHEAVAGVLDLEVQGAAARSRHRTVQFLSVIASMIARAIETSRLVTSERARMLDDSQRTRASAGAELGRLIGTTGAMQAVNDQIARVAPASTTVLIRGESGTGKELIAEAIHARSPRARRPLVTVHCAALPSQLLEAELLGHERGAFTGASATKKGRFELAEGGTLFLDEIGELEPALQIKLVRVLQTREYERVGGTATLRADVRIVAATNRDLEKALATGAFRNDLYHRLNVFTIFVPPLRMRQPDVLLLADEFLHRFAHEHGKEVRRIATPAIDMLMSYHWPGNVRELANAIERAVVVCDGGVLLAHHLPPTLQTAEMSGTGLHRSLEELVEAVERDAIQDALKTARGNRAVAARLLRTTARVLNYKVRNYGIDWRRFRS